MGTRVVMTESWKCLSSRDILLNLTMFSDIIEMEQRQYPKIKAPSATKRETMISRCLFIIRIFKSLLHSITRILKLLKKYTHQTLCLRNYSLTNPYRIALTCLIIPATAKLSSKSPIGPMIASGRRSKGEKR